MTRQGRHVEPGTTMRGDRRRAPITVVVPTYNRAGYLPCALRSILDQSYGDFELLVCDNASTDETADVVKAFDDPRLSYVGLPENVGWLANFNQAVERVSTDYVTIMGDDDLMLPGALERAVAVLDAHPDVGLVHSAFHFIDDRGRTLRNGVNWAGLSADTLEAGDEFARRAMYASVRVCSPSAVMRRAALPRPAYHPIDGYAADAGLWLRITEHWSVYFLSEPGLAYRVHAERVTAAGDSTGDEARSESFEQRARQVRAVRMHALDRFGDRFSDRRGLQRAATVSARRELLDVIRALTLPDRCRRTTFKLLARAVRLDPRVALDPSAWRLAAASLMGPRATLAAKGQAPEEVLLG